MNPLDLLRFATQALLQNRRRSGLSLLGVVIGVVAVVSLTAIGEGALRYVTTQFASLGSSIVNVSPGKNETTGGMPHGIGGVPNDLTLQDAIVLERRVQAVRAAVPVSVSTDIVSYRERGRSSRVVGVTSEFQQLQRLDMASGSFLPESELDRGAAVVVLGHKVAQELFDNANPLGATVRIGSWRMRVIGVLQERGQQLGMDIDDVALIPVASGMRMANKSSVNRIMLDLYPKSDSKPVIAQVKKILIDRHDEEDFTCISQDAVLASLSSILAILTLVVAGIASISLGVAGIGIMNVMLVSVSERTDEVGLLKALGANQRQILQIFLLEATMLSSAGGLIGLASGTALVELGNLLYPRINAATPLWAIAAVLGLSLGTGIVFGVLPAWRASRLDPVAALQGH
ncbi:MAG: ABC transporter permease [Myxococcota bacterium]|jgi:putative ABC transport system permease protein